MPRRAVPVALLALPAGYDGWKLTRKGIWQLKYPYAGRGRITVLVDPAARTFKFTLAKADLRDLEEGPEEVRLLFGEDGATADVDWVPGRKAGDYRFP